MVTETVSKILNDLNRLLADDLSPQSISYRFEKIAALLNKGHLRITQVNCKEYYDDEDLTVILSMKNEALANAQFEQASTFHFIEKELQIEKGNSEFTQLKTEPFFFEYKCNCIVLHFDKKKENQRLIANLIEDYNLHHEKYTSNKNPVLFNAFL